MVFILCSISRRLDIWSVNQSSTYENSEPNVFKKIKSSAEICNIWPNDLLGTNVYKSLEFYC